MNEVNFYSNNDVIEKNCKIIKDELEKKYKRVTTTQRKTPRGYDLSVYVTLDKDNKFRFTFAFDEFIGDAYRMIGYIETCIETNILWEKRSV